MHNNIIFIVLIYLVIIYLYIICIGLGSGLVRVLGLGWCDGYVYELRPKKPDHVVE